MLIQEKTIGIIGAGNMATAIARGLAGRLNGSQLSISDKNRAQLDRLEDLGAFLTEDNRQVAERSDILILAVKPGIYPAVLEELASFSDKLWITIAPGLSISFVKNYLGAEAKVIRTMPNMPAQVNCGMTVYACEPSALPEERQMTEEIFSCLGRVCCLDESLLNATVALNGSAPAYVFMMIEAMADEAVLSGIPRAVAYEIAAQTILGSAKMVLETDLHPAQLKDMVCSPGGTTIEAVEVLEKRGFRFALMDAMEACTEKSQQLSK